MLFCFIWFHAHVLTHVFDCLFNWQLWSSPYWSDLLLSVLFKKTHTRKTQTNIKGNEKQTNNCFVSRHFQIFKFDSDDSFIIILLFDSLIIISWVTACWCWGAPGDFRSGLHSAAQLQFLVEDENVVPLIRLPGLINHQAVTGVSPALTHLMRLEWWVTVFFLFLFPNHHQHVYFVFDGTNRCVSQPGAEWHFFSWVPTARLLLQCRWNQTKQRRRQSHVQIRCRVAFCFNVITAQYCLLVCGSNSTQWPQALPFSCKNYLQKETNNLVCCWRNELLDIKAKIGICVINQKE